MVEFSQISDMYWMVGQARICTLHGEFWAPITIEVAPRGRSLRLPFPPLPHDAEWMPKIFSIKLHFSQRRGVTSVVCDTTGMYSRRRGSQVVPGRRTLRSVGWDWFKPIKHGQIGRRREARWVFMAHKYLIVFDGLKPTCYNRSKRDFEPAVVFLSGLPLIFFVYKSFLFG